MALAEEGLAAARLLLQHNYPGFAASRAYYAMFAAAEAALLSKQLSFSKHSAVISAFGQHFVKSGMLPTELHRYLLDAQKHRQSGDYGGAQTITRQDAETDLRNAEHFVAAVRSHLQP